MKKIRVNAVVTVEVWTEIFAGCVRQTDSIKVGGRIQNASEIVKQECPNVCKELSVDYGTLDALLAHLEWSKRGFKCEDGLVKGYRWSYTSQKTVEITVVTWYGWNFKNHTKCPYVTPLRGNSEVRVCSP